MAEQRQAAKLGDEQTVSQADQTLIPHLPPSLTHPCLASNSGHHNSHTLPFHCRTNSTLQGKGMNTYSSGNLQGL